MSGCPHNGRASCPTPWTRDAPCPWWTPQRSPLLTCWTSR
ncbi:hypothetical protein E2C01_096015 [Portunus trituberculatus]|uniref:Uncharacterized protein n=1 Tax=Portunus trituberculatus TaxID=210409 RepID=A0A5B7K5T8_PORTR|nr:hypothetical protein [Portunus trituberculatus]